MKILKPFATALCLLSSVAMNAATITDSQGIVYNILTEPSAYQPGTCEVGNNQNYSQSTTVVIPASVTSGSNTYSVTVIGNSAFSDCSALTSVDLSGSSQLQSIGRAAFASCSALTSVDLSGCSQLQYIGKYAFYYCSAWTSIDLSGCTALQSIDDYAFEYCESLTSVDLSGCTALQSIGSFAFGSCSSLTSFDLSGCTALQSIGNAAFKYGSSLKTVYIDSMEHWWNVELDSYSSNPLFSGGELYEKNVNGTSLVTKATVPSGRSDLGWHLTSCTSLQEVTFESPQEITSVEDHAFYKCSALPSVDLSGCTALQSIGDYAFGYCTALTSFDNLGSTQLQSIGDYAFRECSVLESVDLSGCAQLQSIGNDAFYYCSALTSVDLSGCIQLHSIGYFAFQGCNLPSVDLSGCTALQSIGTGAFRFCVALKTFYIDSMEHWWNVELDTYESNPLYYYGGELYEKNENGTSLVTKVTVPSGRSNLGWHLTGCASLQEVTFESPQEITSVEDHAFYKCSALPSVDLSGCTALQSIGSDAFYYCTALTSVGNLSGCTALQSIGSDAFYYCSALTAIDLSGCMALQSIGNSAFYYCTALTSVGNLSGCTALQSIGYTAFTYCSALTSLSLPKSLEQVGYMSMALNRNLENVYCYAVNPPEMKASSSPSINYLFSEPMTTTGTLWVPAGSVEAYRNDPYWGAAKYINPITPAVEGLEFEFDESVMGGVEGITLEVGQTYQFTVKPIPADAVLPEITWTSSADDIAYISPEGEVEALAIGEANITAQAMVDEVELTATCKVTVISVPVEKLALSQNEAEVTEGKSIQLYVTFEPADAVPSLTWTVDDEEILSLESLDEAEYTVNGLKPGKATVTVTSNDRLGQSDTCEVTVVEDMSGIASIFADGDEADIEVYDLAGRRVEAETLRAGIYIVRKGAETRKVLVK